MGMLDLPYQAFLYQVHEDAIAGATVVLVAHLGGHPGLGGGGGDLSRFVNSPGQGLLGVAADPLLQGGHGDRGMHVVRS